MLSIITIFGISIWKLYLFSVVFSFCVDMIGYHYFMQSGALPHKFSFYFSSFVLAWIPLMNLSFALKSLSHGKLCCENEEIKNKFKMGYEIMERMKEDFKSSHKKDDEKDER